MAIGAEKWKEVCLNLDFDVDFRLQVSNFGNVRTINKNNEYRIIKASKLRNFRTINRTFYSPRSKKEEKKIWAMKQELSLIKAESIAQKKAIKLLKYKSDERQILRLEIDELEKQYNKLRRQYQKYIAEEMKKRAVVRCWLLHKLVATYFCKQKSAKHSYLLHLDGNKENNHFQNLQWVDADEFNLHKYKNLSSNAKEGKRGDNKLTIEKVKDIKTELKESVAINLEYFAKKYKISIAQVRRIKNAETWNFVKI